MKKISHFFYYLLINYFVMLIISASAISLFEDTLATIITIVSFVAIFPISWSQAKKKVSEISNENQNKYSGLALRVSTSYGNYNDDDYKEVKNSHWYGQGSEIEIQGYKIRDPYIYVTNSREKSLACHIVPTQLKSGKSENFDNIDYWPSYSNLSAGQRGMFLKWMAGGKRDTQIDIGYVFIYFYGLEYRVLKENKDLETIAFEILKLRESYCTNNSFRRYSEGLLAYILSKLDNKMAQEIFAKVEPSLDKYSYIYRSGINLKIKEAKKLTEAELTSAISTFENVKRSSIPGKVGKYFDQYFRIIAKKELEEAMSLIKPKEFNERYHSASSYLRGEYTYKGLRIVVDRKIQNKLGKKWVQAVDALRPYSRKLTKNQPHEIFNLLPQELRQSLDHPLKDGIKKIESTLLGKVVELSQVVAALGVSASGKLKQKESKEVVEALLSANMIIEPNLAYFKKSYKLREKVMISKSENASMLDCNDYKLAALMTDFGVNLAYSDGDYSDAEAKQIYSLVSSEFLKKEIEKEHLKLRVELYKEFKPKMNGVFKKLSENLGLSELKVLSDYLIRIALADGVFRKEEDKKIRTALSKLGLEDSYIKDLYAKFGINGISENIELRQSKENSHKGSLIPNHIQEIKIDKEKLSQLAADTKKVKSILSAIITVEEKEELPPSLQNEIEIDLTLDEKHTKFMEQVITQKEWDKKILREKAKECGLMINAAIFKINEWTEENYGDYLIFEDEKYCIQNELLIEVKNCA